MKAFLRGVRDFSDAIEKGRWKNDANAGEIIRIFAKGVNMPEATIRAMTPQYPDPDGKLNMTSLAMDLAHFKMTGEVQDPKITADMIVDESFAAKAARELGPYNRKN